MRNATNEPELVAAWLLERFTFPVEKQPCAVERAAIGYSLGYRSGLLGPWGRLGGGSACAGNHGLNLRIGIRLIQADFWMLAVENAEDLIGERLPDDLHFLEVQNHGAKPIDSREQPLGLRPGDETSRRRIARASLARRSL